MERAGASAPRPAARYARRMRLRLPPPAAPAAALALLALVALAPARAHAQGEPTPRPPTAKPSPEPGERPAPDDDSLPADDDARPVAVLFGARRTFLVAPPEGWALDRQAAADRGLAAVFRPHDESARDAAAILTAAAFAARDSLAWPRFLDADVATRRRGAPELAVAHEDSLRTSQGRWASVRTFRGDPRGRVVSAAYVDEGREVVTLELRADGETSWRRAFAAFRELVASYARVATEGRRGE